MMASPTETTSRAQSCVVHLFSSTDARLVGGKAASLARAAKAGARVPKGFVVTAPARDLGLAAVRADIAAALADLGPGPFAVRSSAVAEDGSERSFAGQLESELDVSAGDVATAVARCWASSESLRMLCYAGGGAGGVAVIVQAMVRATSAGVAFAADPVSGERDIVLVEAVLGLGDKLVSGAETPESWRADSAGRTRTRSLDKPVLAEAEVDRVATLAREMTSLFGSPQDIEWAIAAGELCLLQSRPITALPAAPIPLAVEAPAGSWGRDDHHGVLSPLGWAWLQPYPKAMAAGLRSVGMPIETIETARIGGHLYMRFVMAGGESEKLPPRWVLWLASRLLPSLRKANRAASELIDGETFLAPLERWETHDREDMRRAIAALFVADPTTLADAELLGKIEAALALTAKGLALHADLGSPSLFGQGKLRLFLEDKLGWRGDELLTLTAGRSTATTALHREVAGIVEAHRVELGLAPFPRTWAALAARAPAMARALATFLDQNRLRMLHYDPKHASLGERPEYLLSIAHGIAEQPRETTPNTSAGDALLDDARGRLAPADFSELERLLDIARRGYASRDENGVETVSRPAGLLRHFVIELGRRIEGAIGKREHAVYLEPSEHAAALAGTLPGITRLIDKRRGEESWALRNRGPRVYGKKPAPMPPADAFPSGLARVMRIMQWMEDAERTPEAPADGLLRGVGLGTVAVTGRARVIHDPSDLSKLRHGEVIVCRITSPEWAVGLGRVAAIVTNEGGMLSHPAIIARELGIPAVLGAASATERVKTGDELRVDPLGGTVAVLP